MEFGLQVQGSLLDLDEVWIASSRFGWVSNCEGLGLAVIDLGLALMKGLG